MSLKNLELKKLLIDLKYYKEELDIKKEMVNDLDLMFNDAVDNFLDNNIEYKNIWNSYIDKKDNYIDELLKKEINKNNIKEEIFNQKQENETIKNNKTTYLKKIYREIVKKTHPDKTKNLSDVEKTNLNSLYKESTEYYKSNNIAELLYCANELNIDLNIEDEKLYKKFKKSLNILKEKSKFLEKTFTWKWYNSDNKTKNSLVELYVKQEIENIKNQ